MLVTGVGEIGVVISKGQSKEGEHGQQSRSSGNLHGIWAKQDKAGDIRINKSFGAACSEEVELGLTWTYPSLGSKGGGLSSKDRSWKLWTGRDGGG